MKNQHMLVSILFADIAGYTGMMEKDENEALGKLNQFKSHLVAESEKFKGDIINFIGDGCLVVFQSSIDAVECALTLQGSFIKSGIPVKVGIHAGDVVYKDKNIFGDAVNITSRIESIGVSSSILISETVRNQIKNKSKFNLISLGPFNFKNVSEPVTVYAICNEGLSIPLREEMEGKLDRKNRKEAFQDITKTGKNFLVAFLGLALIYVILSINGIKLLDFRSDLAKIKDGGIKVFTIKNETGKSDYDWIGQQISEDVADGLQQITGMTIIPPSSLMDYSYGRVLLNKFGFGNTLVEETGVKYIMDGSYRMEENNIRYRVEILNAYTGGSVLPIDIVYSDTKEEEIIIGINKTVDITLGAFMSIDEPLLRDNPPTASCLKEFYNAKRIFSYGKDKEALDYLLKCNDLDPDFVRADLWEASIYIRMADYIKADSLINIIEDKYHTLKQHDKDLFMSLKSGFYSNNKKDHEYFLKVNDYYADDFYINSGAVISAMVLMNDPKQAVAISKNIDWRNLELNQCNYCIERIIVLANAHIVLEEYDKAIEMLEHANQEIIGPHEWRITTTLLRAFVRNNDLQKLNKFIDKLSTQNIKPYSVAQVLKETGVEFLLINNEEQAFEYFDKATELIIEKDDVLNNWNMGTIHLIKGEYDKAEAIFQKYKDYYPTPIGMAYGYQKKEKEALEMVEKIENNMPLYRKGDAYYKKARILASLGKYNEALKALEDALMHGKYYFFYEFQYDPVFLDMFDAREFKNLLKYNH